MSGNRTKIGKDKKTGKMQSRKRAWSAHQARKARPGADHDTEIWAPTSIRQKRFTPHLASFSLEKNWESVKNDEKAGICLRYRPKPWNLHVDIVGYFLGNKTNPLDGDCKFIN